MDRVKTIRNYFIWGIVFILFTYFISYIGLNSSYKNIENTGEVPGGVIIDFAQATSVNGRIFGKVTSTEGNELNNKYLKVDIFSKSKDLIGTKYLKLENLNLNEQKKFAVYYQAENVKYYTIDVLDDSEEVEREAIRVRNVFKNIFKDQDTPMWLIVLLVLYAFA